MTNWSRFPVSTKERPGDNNGSTGSTMLAIKAKSLRIALTDSVFIQRAVYHKRTDDPLVIRHIPLGNYQTVISSNTLILSRKSLQVLTTKTPSERERERKKNQGQRATTEVFDDLCLGEKAIDVYIAWGAKSFRLQSPTEGWIIYDGKISGQVGVKRNTHSGLCCTGRETTYSSTKSKHYRTWGQYWLTGQRRLAFLLCFLVVVN